MSAIGPCSATIDLSESMKGTPSRRATRLPTFVFPAPGGPMITSRGPAASDSTDVRRGARAEGVGDGREVGLEVAPRLGDRVAAELLDHRVREHERDHRLGHHAG